MKDVEWIGEERMIPSYGMGIKGKIKTLPNDMADSFIEQGLAKNVKLKKQTKKEDL